MALLSLAAVPQRHGAGQISNRRPVESSRLPALLAMAITPSGTAQDGHRDPCPGQARCIHLIVHPQCVPTLRVVKDKAASEQRGRQRK
jgi:hypothetical protein